MRTSDTDSPTTSETLGFHVLTPAILGYLSCQQGDWTGNSLHFGAGGSIVSYEFKGGVRNSRGLCVTGTICGKNSFQRAWNQGFCSLFIMKRLIGTQLTGFSFSPRWWNPTSPNCSSVGGNTGVENIQSKKKTFAELSTCWCWCWWWWCWRWW